MKQQGAFYGWQLVWNKIYKKSLCDECLPFFKNIQSHLIMTDDIAFSCVFWSLAKKVSNVHDVYYFYLQHGAQSIAGGSLEKFKKNVTDIAEVFDFFKKILIELDNFYRYENDFAKFKELYIKIWSRNAKNFENDEVRKAEEMIKNLFDANALPELREEDDAIYRHIEYIKIIEIKAEFDCEDFLNGEPKWKKTAFLWLFKNISKKVR
jgi:hypothetical protein